MDPVQVHTRATMGWTGLREDTDNKIGPDGGVPEGKVYGAAPAETQSDTRTGSVRGAKDTSVQRGLERMEFTALFCDNAETCDRGKLHIHGVFDELYAPGFPARQDCVYLAGIVHWDRADHGRYPFRIDLVDPSARPIFTIEGFTDVESRSDQQPPAKTHLVFPMQNLVFISAGRYRLLATINDEQHHGPSLHLMQASAETAQ
jgi:hypothetical protein